MKMSVGGLIGLSLLAVIGLALTPVIVESAASVTGTGGNNLTGAAKTIVELFPLFWVILMIAIFVGSISGWLNWGG